MPTPYYTRASVGGVVVVIESSGSRGDGLQLVGPGEDAAFMALAAIEREYISARRYTAVPGLGALAVGSWGGVAEE
jgi:hypothetical protein